MQFFKSLSPEQPNASSPTETSPHKPQQVLGQWQGLVDALRRHYPSSINQHQHQHQHQPQQCQFQWPPSSLKTHLEKTVENIGDRAKEALLRLGGSFSGGGVGGPVWARASSVHQHQPQQQHSLTMASTRKGGDALIEERLAGVPVYALSNAAEEFVLISSPDKKSLGLLCFREEDAQALLQQMKSMDPSMRQGSKVVAIALNKVFQLKVDGVAFRFIPDSSQIINALKEKDKVGDSAGSFSGVPVFQSRSLTLRSQDNRYRPLFFRKEDLDKSLERASREQKSLNPAFKKGDVQVCILEDIVRGMKGEDSANSKWDDVVFIPPGFDVSVNRDSQESKQHLLTQLRRT